MDAERIMERVRRLLAIANDPAASDNEQRIALEQAQRLMDRHAIEEWQLEEDHDAIEIIRRMIHLEANPCNWYMAELANIVALGNRCRASYGWRRAGNGRNVVCSISIYGARSDVDKTEAIWTAMETSRAAMWRGTGQDDTTRESERGMEERLLPRIPGGDRPQIPDPPAGDGIGWRRQGTRHRPRQPGRPMGRKTRHLQRQSAETLQAHGIQPVRLPARTTGRGTPGHRTQGDRQGRRLGSGKVGRHLQNITHV